MKVVKSTNELLAWRNQVKKNRVVGFVPTMGALHAGHLSLVKSSIENSDITIVSIFVNPKQFSANEDFDTYPRNLEKDLDSLGGVGVDVVFIPKHEDIYNKNIQEFSFEHPLTKILEGRARPHFFPGVINVVSRLFNIVNPNVAYFGKKDAQQLLLIEKMVQLGGYPIKVVRGETVREPNGLAMSSRNQYLSASAKERAACLNLSLVTAENMLDGGETRVEKIKKEMFEVINKDESISIGYVSILCLNTLVEVNNRVNGPILISIAVVLGGVRLIDNIFYDSISKPMSTL